MKWLMALSILSKIKAWNDKRKLARHYSELKELREADELYDVERAEFRKR